MVDSPCRESTDSHQPTFRLAFQRRNHRLLCYWPEKWSEEGEWEQVGELRDEFLSWWGQRGRDCWETANWEVRGRWRERKITPAAPFYPLPPLPPQQSPMLYVNNRCLNQRIIFKINWGIRCMWDSLACYMLSERFIFTFFEVTVNKNIVVATRSCIRPIESFIREDATEKPPFESESLYIFR